MSLPAWRHSLSLVAGFLVRPCCSIPLALAFLGIGGAGVAAALAPYRALFLVVAAVFFSVSFYLNFIRNRNRSGMIVWGVSLGLSSLLLLSPVIAGSDQNAPAGGTPAADSKMKTTEYQIEGMACQACARRLQNKLTEAPGVDRASVSFAEKRATVTYDDEKISPRGIEDVVARTGFRATTKSDVNP